MSLLDVASGIARVAPADPASKAVSGFRSPRRSWRAWVAQGLREQRIHAFTEETMGVSLIILSLGVGLALGGEPKVDGVKAEMKKLEGTWVWTHSSRKGIKFPVPPEVVFVFGTDGSVVQKEKGQPEKKITYRVDPSKMPGEMDFFYPDGKMNLLAVYELDGDTLRFGAIDDGEGTKKRPGKLDADDAYLWYLKRQKK